MRRVAHPVAGAALHDGRGAGGAGDAEQALEATGYERGTIVPLGSTTAWPVFADASIFGRIVMGAGRHGASLLVDAAALIRSLDATVADICTEPEG